MSYVDTANGAVPHYVLVVTTSVSFAEQIFVPLDFTAEGSTCSLQDVVPGMLMAVRGATTAQGVLRVRWGHRGRGAQPYFLVPVGALVRWLGLIAALLRASKCDMDAATCQVGSQPVPSQHYIHTSTLILLPPSQVGWRAPSQPNLTAGLELINRHSSRGVYRST